MTYKITVRDENENEWEFNGLREVPAVQNGILSFVDGDGEYSCFMTENILGFTAGLEEEEEKAPSGTSHFASPNPGDISDKPWWSRIFPS